MERRTVILVGAGLAALGVAVGVARFVVVKREAEVSAVESAAVEEPTAQTGATQSSEASGPASESAPALAAQKPARLPVQRVVVPPVIEQSDVSPRSREMVKVMMRDYGFTVRNVYEHAMKLLGRKRPSRHQMTVEEAVEVWRNEGDPN
jgi:hypothetical protein